MTTQRLYFVVAICLSTAACGRLVDDHPPGYRDLGMGQVTSIREVTVDNGESNLKNAAFGLVTGGVIGMYAGIGFGEKNLGQAKQAEYLLKMNGGTEVILPSFSNVSLGDCVQITRIGTRSDVVLERVTPNSCG